MNTRLRALPTAFRALLEGAKASYEYLGLSILYSVFWLALHFPYAMILWVTITNIVATYPDNGQVPYVADRGGTTRLYLAAQKNGAVWEVPVPALAGPLDPALSADGTRIALVAGGVLHVMNADGTEREALTGPGRYAHPAFSPDGGWIVYVAFDQAGRGELYGIDLGSRQTRRLTANEVQDLDPAFAVEPPPPRAGGRGRAEQPARRQDGGLSIVFSRPDKDGNLELFMMGAEGGEARQLTRTGPLVSNREPCASPDGSRIAFISRIGGRAELWTIDADGTERRRLTGEGRVEGAPVFSSSGTKIYYAGERTEGGDGAAPIRVINADGTWDRPLTKEATDSILRYLALLGFLGLILTGPLLAAPANAAMIYVSDRAREGEARIRDFFLGFARFFPRSAAIYASFLLAIALLGLNLVVASQMRIWLGKISMVLSGYALLLVLLLSVHFFPLIVLQPNSIWKVWRKSFLLTLDNGLLTLVFSVISVILWAVSGLTCFILALFYPAVLGQASQWLFTSLLDKYDRLEQTTSKTGGDAP